MGIDIEREWAAVSAAPTLFIGATIVVSGLIWVALHFLYRHRIDGFKEDIERLRHRLVEASNHPPPIDKPVGPPPGERRESVSALPARAAAAAGTGQARNPKGFDWTDVVDLTPGQVEAFMKSCSTRTTAGLRVIAEHGPVIHASLLDRAGIENYGHFQGRVTLRTRTVTGNPDAYLLAWDDWQSKANAGTGHYAVTAKTHRSLRIYFQLD
jgi:hypothetical protein